ncbi:MAG: Uma2 family endonuclease [Planctomycetes bacterium]|nr:Uma2 family endonuclease [Planctomycetota bacterium]
MSSITVNGLEIPAGALTLEGFREWVALQGEDAPRVHYSRGRVHIEMPQDCVKHGPVVFAINDVLRALTRELDTGRYYEPPTWITDDRSLLSTEPDGFFVSWASLESGRVRINPDRSIELLGRPDMVLEVVSKSSERKDRSELVSDYAGAGVPEYWIADGRTEPLVLRILVLSGEGAYREEPADAEGWSFSPTWGRRFRLVRFLDRAGLTDFRLETERAS